MWTYAEAHPWAVAIKEEVLARRMPPWGAVKGFGEFRDDGGLTQEQIEWIADWVVGGAPEGDPALLPKAPSFAKAAAVHVPPGTRRGSRRCIGAVRRFRSKRLPGLRYRPLEQRR